MKRAHVFLILLALVSVRLALMAGLDAHTYWTFDEPWNTETAKQVVVEKQFRRTKDSFTPISVLNVYVGEKLMAWDPRWDKLSAYRFSGIIVNQAAVPLTYGFARLLGTAAPVALFFTALLSLDPNLLGHTILASNVDGYIFTWFILLALCAFYWTDRKNWKRAALFGFVLGLAQGVKLTSAYAVPLCAGWLIAGFYRGTPVAQRKEKFKQFGIFLLASWLGLNAFYAFNKLGEPLGEIHFTSPLFMALAKMLPALPAPVPVDFLQGLDMCLHTDAEPRPVYIMNQYFMHGVWYYFLYALLLKTPLPTLASAAVGWLVLLKKRAWNLKVGFLILFSAFFMFYFSVLFNGQVGIRYLFPIYGFLMAGVLWFPWTRKTMILASVWMVASLTYNWPNFIGYFNELVPVKHHRWWHLGDSNLTWNQEWKDWPNFVKEKRLSMDQVGPPTLPLNLPFYEDAITVSGVLRNRPQLGLLRDHFQPRDSFWGVKLEYLITPQDVLKELPPAEGPSPLPLTQEVRNSICRPGFQDEDGHLFMNLNLRTFGEQSAMKTQEFVTQIRVIHPTDAFFEMSADGFYSAFLNGTMLFSNNEPGIKLAGKTLSLQPGTYSLELHYTQNWGRGILSFRGLDLSQSKTSQPLNNLIFCAP